MVPFSVKNLDELRTLIHAALTPELLSATYKDQWSPRNPTQGFCSVASEAAWFVLGGNKKGWNAHVTQDPDGGTHWWLENNNGLRFDPTEEQYHFHNQDPPYLRGHVGKAGGFMGIRRDPDNAWGFERKPSKRAEQLLQRMYGIQRSQKIKSKLQQS